MGSEGAHGLREGSSKDKTFNGVCSNHPHGPFDKRAKDARVVAITSPLFEEHALAVGASKAVAGAEIPTTGNGDAEDLMAFERAFGCLRKHSLNAAPC
jgi:hypothetical protein